MRPTLLLFAVGASVVASKRYVTTTSSGIISNRRNSGTTFSRINSKGVGFDNGSDHDDDGIVNVVSRSNRQCNTGLSLRAWGIEHLPPTTKKIITLRGGQGGRSGFYDGGDDDDDDRYYYSSSQNRQGNHDDDDYYYGGDRNNDNRYDDSYRGYDDRWDTSSRRDDQQSTNGSMSSTFSMPNIIKSGNRKIGLPLLGIGAALTVLGMSLFFNKALMRLGNLFFVAGVPMTIGPGRIAGYFFQPKKARATGCLVLGIFLVFVGRPLLGIILEIFGVLNLFGNMFPVAFAILKTMPVIGPILSGRDNNNNNNNRRNQNRNDRYDDNNNNYDDDYYYDDRGSSSSNNNNNNNNYYYDDDDRDYYDDKGGGYY